MATEGSEGRFEGAGEPVERTTRLGRTLVLFGVLSVGGGVGLVALTDAFRFAPELFWTYRSVALGVAGLGLPALLYGAVAVTDGGSWTADVCRIGVFVSTLAVIAFLAAYPEQWGSADASTYVTVTLGAYGSGMALCSVAAGGAVLHRLGTGDESDGETESEFIWGGPPDD